MERRQVITLGTFLLAVGASVLLFLSAYTESDGAERSSSNRRLLLIDPKTVVSRVPRAVRWRQKMDKSSTAYFTIADGIQNQNEDMLLPEIFIEVHNPVPGYQYSVTFSVENEYTGTAMLIHEEEKRLLYAWKPLFPDQYTILVHEIGGGKQSPLIHPSPRSITVGDDTDKAKNEVIVQSIYERLAMPPCQTLSGKMDAFSVWDGDWLGPDFKLQNLDKIRTGWSFLPGRQMNCRLETFSHDDLLSVPTKKSIYIIGTSKERGVFLSLVDLLLAEEDKVKDMHRNVVGKCWGRALVQKGNLQVMYQDFRVKEFEPPSKSNYMECHNDKVVHDGDTSFIKNATVLWQEVFEEEANWPDVIHLLSGYGWGEYDTFDFESHTLSFVRMLPPSWNGVLLIQDGQFSAREAGLRNFELYEKYRTELMQMLNAINDPRVRWIDGMGLSKDHRMHSSKGPEGTATSAHFHWFCGMYKENGGTVYTPSGDIDERNSMKICSNITEVVAQLLVGHALGPKEEFLEQVRQAPVDPNRDMQLTLCHACPKSLFPFHITPHPQMTCVKGPLHPLREDELHQGVSQEPQLCPADCLRQDVTYSMSSESDVINVRQCIKG